ncbi:hypothetical protein D9613_010365 [Agrocybe pediades]|uniref:Uncharacterized protein n=1 Tax=Agrocybe pediades TaxID=84607 RepID=A0A8H4QG58_9AGAR|nr:hypothetical protein D9613_010365 [Agrocybe pediades]
MPHSLEDSLELLRYDASRTSDLLNQSTLSAEDQFIGVLMTDHSHLFTLAAIRSTSKCRTHANRIQEDDSVMILYLGFDPAQMFFSDLQCMRKLQRFSFDPYGGTQIGAV